MFSSLYHFGVRLSNTTNSYHLKVYYSKVYVVDHLDQARNFYNDTLRKRCENVCFEKCTSTHLHTSPSGCKISFCFQTFRETIWMAILHFGFWWTLWSMWHFYLFVIWTSFFCMNARTVILLTYHLIILVQYHLLNQIKHCCFFAC